MTRIPLIACAAALGLVAGAAQAQDAATNGRVDIGAREYRNSCAACHGMEGKGDGPLADQIGIAVPDLTTIQARNDGVFPYARLYDIVDGRAEVQWHGSREMPVWGDAYRAEAPWYVGPYMTQADAESFVRGRILALLGHIHEIQEK